MQLHYLTYIQLGIVFRRMTDIDENEMYELNYSVHYHPYRVMLLPSMWQAYNKIHVHMFPLPSRNGNIM